jgi:hypothetical protein
MDLRPLRKVFIAEPLPNRKVDNWSTFLLNRIPLFIDSHSLHSQPLLIDSHDGRGIDYT